MTTVANITLTAVFLGAYCGIATHVLLRLSVPEMEQWTYHRWYWMTLPAVCVATFIAVGISLMGIFIDAQSSVFRQSPLFVGLLTFSVLQLTGVASHRIHNDWGITGGWWLCCGGVFGILAVVLQEWLTGANHLEKGGAPWLQITAYLIVIGLVLAVVFPWIANQRDEVRKVWWQLTFKILALFMPAMVTTVMVASGLKV